MTIAVDYTGNITGTSNEKNKEICEYYPDNCDQAYNLQIKEDYCEKNSINCKIYSDLKEMELLEELN